MIIRIAFTISYELNVLFAIAFRKFQKNLFLYFLRKYCLKLFIPVLNVVYTYISVV